MLTPEALSAWIEHHFDTVTDEEFLRNLERAVTPTEWAEISVQVARHRAAQESARLPAASTSPSPARPE
jgi:hypothetical protein